MKKVRYAIGVGVFGAVPALGLMAPAAANAATHPAPPARNMAKRVSPTHTNGNGTVIQAASCGSTHYSLRAANGLHAFDQYAGDCIHFQSAWIDLYKTGLTERVRFYSVTHGNLIYTAWNHGAADSATNQTTFDSYPNIAGVREVCEALVANGNHNHVEYGPVCENA